VKHCEGEQEPLSRQLEELLAALDMVLPQATIAAVVEHLCWVLKANATINLTAITDPATALRLHVLDSLTAVPEITASPAGRLCDIGTGAGFPGVPLALASGRETLLLDSVGKKMRVLQEFLDEAGLTPPIRTHVGRAEDLALLSPAAFSVVTTRAVSQLASLVELAAPLLSRGGHLIALKGPVSADEVRAGSEAARLCGLELVGIRRISLPEGNESRSIVTFAATGAPRLKLPRRNGLAQSKPLA